MARLNYLTSSDHARQAARDAGLTVTDRTLKAWLEGKRHPSGKNLKKIDDAYRVVRRRNVARHLLKRLNANGGTRVEIHPLNSSVARWAHNPEVAGKNPVPATAEQGPDPFEDLDPVAFQGRPPVAGPLG